MDEYTFKQHDYINFVIDYNKGSVGLGWLVWLNILKVLVHMGLSEVLIEDLGED